MISKRMVVFLGEGRRAPKMSAAPEQPRLQQRLLGLSGPRPKRLLASSPIDFFGKNPFGVNQGYRFFGKQHLLRNTLVTPAPHIQGKNMNKHLDKIRPQMLQNKANAAFWGPYFCSYFCLVCGGWGRKKNPHLRPSELLWFQRSL